MAADQESILVSALADAVLVLRPFAAFQGAALQLGLLALAHHFSDLLFMLLLELLLVLAHLGALKQISARWCGTKPPRIRTFSSKRRERCSSRRLDFSCYTSQATENPMCATAGRAKGGVREGRKVRAENPTSS
jgi:hypothetical protein